MKVTVTDKTSGGEDITVYVKSPNNKQLTEVKMHHAILFANALKQGVASRATLNECLKAQGLWSDEKQERVNEIRKILSESEAQLSRGAKTPDGKVLTKEDAKQIATRMRELRSEYYAITSILTEHDANTAESISENGQFELLCCKCIVDEEGKPVCKNLDEYSEKKDEPYIVKAATELAKITNEYDKDWYKKLPEIKFLIKYKYMDEDGRLINSDGKYIDEKGRLVNKDYKLVNEQGQLINEYGDLVDDTGSVVDFVEFE